MNDRTCDAVLITPTLDPLAAARTLADARAAAGVPCAILMASDQGRRGAVVANNVLISAALEWGARYVVYINDDASEFPAGWLARLIEAVESQPHYGTAVAGAPCRTRPQCKGGPNMPRAIIELDRPSAWVVAVIKADVIRTVGFLDEGLIHYADDSDFEMRMRDAGYVAVYVQDVWVNHSKPDDGHIIADWYDHDKRRFIDRWGKV